MKRPDDHRGRVTLFFAGAVGMAALFLAAFLHLPGPVEMADRYRIAIDTRTFPERNVTDTVSAVNFDIRGFDTVGEEFILFVSVVGSIALLRQSEEKHDKKLPDALEPYRDVGPGETIRLWLLIMIAPKLLWGIYIVDHGQLSPGGGFQGGVILASVALIVYLGENFEAFKKIMSHSLVEIAEAGGAGGFVLIGLVAMFQGHAFLTNTLPMGKATELTSGGTMPLISAAVGIEVMAGFVILLYAFLQETLSPGD